MIGEKVENKKYISLPAVSAILKTRMKDVEEPKYEQDTTAKYVAKFMKLDPKKAAEMEKEIIALDLLKDMNIVKIIDLMPSDKIDLDLILSDKRTALTDDQSAQLLAIVKKFSK